MAKGTLIAAMGIGRVADDEFHDWYDTEHVPERERVPGFLLCRRWLGVDDPRISVATYDLESPAVVESGEWKTARESDWTTRLKPHFRDHLRLVLRRYRRSA